MHYTKEQVQTLLYQVVDMVDESYRPQTKDNIKGYEFLKRNIDSILDGTYFSPIEKTSTGHKTYPFTAYHLYSKLGFERFRFLTGADYRNEDQICDTDIFYVSEWDARAFKLL